MIDDDVLDLDSTAIKNLAIIAASILSVLGFLVDKLRANLLTKTGFNSSNEYPFWKRNCMRLTA